MKTFVYLFKKKGEDKIFCDQIDEDSMDLVVHFFLPPPHRRMGNSTNHFNVIAMSKKKPTAPEPPDPAQAVYLAFKQQVKDDLKSGGLRGIRLKIEFLKANPNYSLKSIGNADMLRAYENVLKEETDKRVLKQYQ